MTEPVGHDALRRQLGGALWEIPQLLCGPASIGKWTIARWAASLYARGADRWEDEHPRMDRIRELSRFLGRAPIAGPVKIALINLDGANAAVQHALLKDLEEPPEYARFIVVSSRAPVPTITSRCWVWQLGPLTDAQVAEVLVRLGKSEAQAALLAPMGRGRVAPALVGGDRFSRAKSSVLGLLRAVQARDRDGLEVMLADWGEIEDSVLRELLGAAASGRPSALFTASERQVIGSSTARRAIAWLSASGRVRPAASVRAMAARLMED